MADIFELFKKIEKKSDSAGPISFIVAGLGNPGKEYRNTRHNTGFLALEYMCGKENFEINRSKFHSLCGEHTIDGVRCLFMMPETFMNNSGEAIRDAAEFYKIPPERILVIYDDTSLDVGRMRIRAKGSDGGHNGIKSIIYHLRSDAFPRIKIGVGKKPHPDYDLADWVLGNFSSDEQKAVFDVFEKARLATHDIVCEKLTDAANKFNG